MTLKILVTGSTGNVGRAVVDCLVEMGAPVRAAVRPSEIANTPNLPAGVEITPFDLGDPTTFAPALAGVDRLFLMRPPAITDIEHTIKPFVETAARMGVRHITFLSLIGAESNRLVPHRAVEDLLIAGDVPYTLLRAGFFMQNLDTTHRAEIRDENEIFIPAGHGRTAFIDVRDIAAVAAKTLTESGHDNVAYPLTGEESLTYDEVADVLTASLGRPITYTHPQRPPFCVAALAQRSTPELCRCDDDDLSDHSLGHGRQNDGRCAPLAGARPAHIARVCGGLCGRVAEDNRLDRRQTTTGEQIT